MNPIRHKIRTKMAIAFLAPTVLILAVFDYFSYYRADKILEEDLGRTLMNIAASVASTFERYDGFEAKIINKIDDKNHTQYGRVKSFLDHVKLRTSVERIVILSGPGTEAELANGVHKIKVDTEGREVDLGDYTIDLDRYEIGEMLKTKKPVVSILRYKVEGRTFKTAYAPIIVNDAVELIVAVDGSPRYYEGLNELARSLFIYSLFALATIFGVSLLLSRGIVTPIVKLVGMAKRIGEGQIKERVAIDSNDEIGFLGTTLEEMRARLAKREEELQMMLSGIAHEVRNPLGGIELFCGLLEEEMEGKPTGVEHLKRIQKEVRYLDKIVNDFLSFARQMPLEFTDISLRDMFFSVQMLLSSELEKYDVRFEMTETDEVLQGDRARLDQVFLNLFRNAIQAQKENGGICRVTWTTVLKPEETVVITVEDNGKGIPEANRQRIFEPFFTSKEQGTGLGLAIVRKIILGHGGTIQLDEPREKGAAFIIELPKFHRERIVYGENTHHRG